MENSKLRITSVSDEKTSSDNRNYRTVGFEEALEGNVLSNSRSRVRNIWEEGPYNSPGDSLYKHLAQQQANIEAGRLGALVYGSIERVDVENFFIPSSNGKHVNPETGEMGNIASSFTSVVFSDESIESIARGQKLTIKGEKPLSEVSLGEELEEEELVAQVEAGIEE